MREKVLFLILTAVVSFPTLAADVRGGGEEIAPLIIESPGERRPEPILHAGANILIRNREHPLWVYKELCEEEIVPQFLAELEKESHDLAKELAETIVVQVDQPLEGIWIYIKDGHPRRVDCARKLAEMALRRFNALDQSMRVRLMGKLAEEKDAARAKYDDSNRELGDLQRYLAKVKLDTNDLREQLSSYRGQLAQAEMTKAELETKLELLTRKAEKVKDTVSSEQIAALEKAVQQLEMQIEEHSTEDALKKCAIILRQKEQELARATQLRERAVISEADVQKAQYDLELARTDFERAKQMEVGLKNRLEKVAYELSKAKEEFAQTGGLALATIIAQKTLECETELVSLEGKIENLRDRIGETESRLDRYRQIEEKVERAKAHSATLEEEYGALRAREQRLDARIRKGVEISKSPEDYYRVGGYESIGEERPGMYDVVGAVNKPGTLKLQPETTIVKAIRAAGGFADDADTENVVVLRATRKAGPQTQAWDARRHVIDCRAILEGTSADDFLIEPDDTVVVPTRESAN